MLVLLYHPFNIHGQRETEFHGEQAGPKWCMLKLGCDNALERHLQATEQHAVCAALQLATSADGTVVLAESEVCDWRQMCQALQDAVEVAAVAQIRQATALLFRRCWPLAADHKLNVAVTRLSILVDGLQEI